MAKTKDTTIDDIELGVHQRIDEVEQSIKDYVDSRVGEPVALQTLDADRTFAMCLDAATKGILAGYGNNVRSIIMKGQMDLVVNDICDFAQALHDGVIKRFTT